MDWKIRETDYSEERIPTLGNRFFTGNGYLGIRGTLEEYTKKELVAVNLAGIFDQVGDGWREPLNAPNGLLTYIRVDGRRYALPETEPLEHEMELDYRKGIWSRLTRWKTDRGEVCVRSERFASRDEVHLIGMRYSVTVDYHARVELYTGIDGAVWDIHGPHYDRMDKEKDGDGAVVQAITHEKGEMVTVMEQSVTDFPREKTHLFMGDEAMTRYSFISEPGKLYTLDKGIVVFTSKDEEFGKGEGRLLLNRFIRDGYERTKERHAAEWEKKWQDAEVLIQGDDLAMESLNYSIYQLLCIAPAHAESMSIPARGLSGQTYKGAVFWDTEMFMLDFFLFTDPRVARTLMKYRVDTLEGAKEKAKQYGWDGAFYAWESQEGGYDACTDYNVVDVFTGRPMRTYFRDKQYHISSAVAYGIMRYGAVTGDDSLLEDGGIETVIECARFYYSLLVRRACRDQYEILDVIGPDEYHERVNNNAYTNRMARFTLDAARGLLENLDRLSPETAGRVRAAYPVEELIEQFGDASGRLYLQKPGKDGVIPQFDGYFALEDVSVDTVRSRLKHPKEYWGGAYGVASHTRVIKQADVVTMLSLFPGEYSADVNRANWEYYEPRTEHGSSLSACMYAMLACRCGMPEKAYPFFTKSARADLTDGGKEWAGLIYIGGTHPAAAGGAYMTAVEGFGGLYPAGEELCVKASLPREWEKLSYTVWWRGKRYRVESTREETKISAG